MPSVRYGVFAIALGLTIATGAAAEELATCGANPSHRMADLPRVAFRSFWPMEGYSRQFAEAGIKLVFVFPANTICSLNVPYSNYPQIWTGPNQYHWNSLDDHLDDVLKWNPRAKLMVMVDLNTPAWWVRSHGGEDARRRRGRMPRICRTAAKAAVVPIPSATWGRLPCVTTSVTTSRSTCAVSSNIPRRSMVKR